jgi:uncharacterized membrane protein
MGAIVFRTRTRENNGYHQHRRDYMIAEILVLRLVHILGGIFWLGSGLFTSFFLVPALTQSGSAAGQVMVGLQQRRLFTVLPTVGVLTIVSGLRLMWITSGGFSPAYFSTTVGRTYTLSGAAAILAFLLSTVLARPAAVRAATLGRTLATTTDSAAKSALTAEMESARRRGSIASKASIALLVFSAAGMAVARYLGGS